MKNEHLTSYHKVCPRHNTFTLTQEEEEEEEESEYVEDFDESDLEDIEDYEMEMEMETAGAKKRVKITE